MEYAIEVLKAHRDKLIDYYDQATHEGRKKIVSQIADIDDAVKVLRAAQKENA